MGLFYHWIAKIRENREIMRKHIFLRFFVFYAFFSNTGLFKFIGLRKYAKTAKLCENIFLFFAFYSNTVSDCSSA